MMQLLVFLGVAAGIGAPRLDVEPVTNAEFRAFVVAHPEWRRDRVPRLFADADYLAHWSGPTTLGPRARSRAPVVRVSWFAARAYCAARGGRLPTEAEWDLAAGDSADDLAWFARPTPDVLPDVTGRVDAHGVADLHGLVWEWVEDFGSALIGTDAQQACGAEAIAAKDPRAYATFMRNAFRNSLEAHYTTTSLGFRCAYDGTAAAPARSRPATAESPGGPSIYDLDVHLRDAAGRDVGLDVLRGHRVLVAMFYTSCPATCPILIDDIARLLAEAKQPDARVLLISFDPEHDTPARLAELARARRLDARWELAAASAYDARTIAAVLGIKYKHVASGSFVHGYTVVALDGDGHPRARSQRAGDHGALVQALAH
jgi:cytochrome oxidase Cu insertion factor (SCO1/SenC/PrrC family)